MRGDSCTRGREFKSQIKLGRWISSSHLCVVEVNLCLKKPKLHKKIKKKNVGRDHYYAPLELIVYPSQTK